MKELTLDDFCHHLISGGAPDVRLHPTAIAREFIDYFGLSAFPDMAEIETLLERADIATVVRSRDTRGLRGYHTGTKDGGYIIVIDDSEWDGAQEYTTLHEAYEIVRERLRDLYPRVGAPQGRSKCRQADGFAAAALMQPYWFSLFAEASGFDVVALQRTYGRAYSSLTIRMAEVMRHQPLLAVLYERGATGDPREWAADAPPEVFKAKVVARTPGFRLRTSKRPLSNLRGLLPRRGAPPAQCSVAERVILTGRPVYVEKVSGYDLWRNDDVTVAARPASWHGRLAKVALIAVPYRDRSVLRPQLAHAYFDRIPHAHQVI